MAVCPNCGGMLRFDIPTQGMKCDSCTSTFDPYAFQYGNSAEESTEYDVTVFKCPQCGGEIYSTDQTAAGFCSYCGSSSVLEGHLTKEKRPEFIIPFKKTKQDCKDLFKKFTKKSIFAPSDFKDESTVESFRGIYMPYWLYDMSQRGRITVPTSTSHRSGDYIITDHYNCSGDLDNAYNGVSYDASSAFADDISNEIAPFNVKDITAFSPAFLSGFYADVSDVPASVYEGAAVELAQESTYNYLKKGTPMSHEHFEKDKKTVKSMINTQINVERSAMFPVWFLAYRRRNRVAYATVNGQTGKISSDVPVSIPKYLVCAAVLAIAFFLVFQLVFTLTPAVLLAIVAVLAMISAIMYASGMKKIVAKDNFDNDLGLQDRMNRKKESRMKAQNGATFSGEEGAYILTDRDIRNNKRRMKAQKKEGQNRVGSIITIVFFLMFGSIFFNVFSVFISSAIPELASGVGIGLTIIALLVSVILTITSTNNIKASISKRGISSILWTDIGLVFILIVLIVKPVSDYIYYFAGAVAMFVMLITIIDLIRSFNLLAMRPLPQFEMYQGGDDRA